MAEFLKKFKGIKKMSNYTIVGLTNNQIFLAFDGRRVNFPLPIVDGLYPQGENLRSLLEQYVANAQAAANAPPQVASNLDAITALVTPPTDAQVAEMVRTQRNQLIFATDKTQLKDAPASGTLQMDWATYRAALRDLPIKTGFPTAPSWPIPPIAVVSARGVVLTNADGSPTQTPRLF